MKTLENLKFLWESGLEYIDIEATLSEDKDRIAFIADENFYLLIPLSVDEYEELIYLGP